jgi:serine/threonine protein kinase
VNRKTDLPDARTSGQIAGYRLDGCIAQSDTATVYLARDERLDRQVALKVLAPELAAEAAFRTRLLRESRAAAAVGHPHIIPVYEDGDAGGTLYVAMRYVEGGDTRAMLSRLGQLPLDAAWNIIAQVGSALDAAHTHGLIHRDVKPANILVEASIGSDDSQAAGGYTYLADFGMGTDTAMAEVITAARSTGTFDYVAPEQIEGRALDGRTDLYALACTGFELLCGTPLFGRDESLTVMYAQLYVPPPSARAWRRELPVAVDRVLATALAKNPADRYATCGQFAAELFEALGLAGGPASPARSRPPDQAGPDQAGPDQAGPDQAGPDQAAPTMAREGQEPRPDQDGPDQKSGPVSSGPSLGTRPGGSLSSPEQPPAGSDRSEPADVPPAPHRPSRRSGAVKLIIAGAVAAVAAAVITSVVAPKRSASDAPAVSRPAATSAPSTTPSPTLVPPPSASGQAAAVDHLLDSSAATRKALHGAVNDVYNCTNLASAASQIQNAVNQRATEYRQASALSASALANGTAVKSDLIAALRASLDADKDYLTWAHQQMSGCTPAARATAFSAASSADELANTAKQAFVQVWNPVAAKYGVQQKSASSI